MKRFWTILGLILMLAGPAWAATTRYAGPAGSGTTCSAGSPCSLAYLWTVTVAGDTILLNDGHYTGANYMMTPTAYLSGTASLPITVRAVNDGEAWFDGQSARRPCYLSHSDYWVWEGFNCSDSLNDVVALSYSNHNTLRRIVAWDVLESANNHVFAVNFSSFENLIEDSVGFGSGRKIFTHYSGAGSTTLRRVWGHWMKSTRTDPKMTLSPWYNSYNFTCDNCIFTYDEQSGSDTTQRFGIVVGDRLDATGEAGRKANINIYGSIAMLVNGWTANSSLPVWGVSKIGAVHLTNVVGFLGSNFITQKPFSLSNCWLGHSDSTPCASPDLSITNASSIGATASSISANWTQTNVVSGANVAAVYTNGSLWKHTGSLGATICNRYQNGVLTSTPLFPADGLWPMDARAYAAQGDAGYPQFHITTVLTGAFGAIDSDCIAGGAPSASIAVTIPAGHAYYTNNTMPVTWQTQGISSGVVDIQFSIDDGSNYLHVSNNAYDQGTYNFTLDGRRVSETCKVKICKDATCGESESFKVRGQYF